MKLYHFTSTLQIKFIRDSGALSLGDIPLRQTPNYGEDGHAVWLTTEDYAHKCQHGLISHVCDKTEVRFTINLPKDDPKLFKWSEYAKANNMKRDWYAALDNIGAGFADTWWLYKGSIPIDGLEVAIKRDGIYQPIDIKEILPPSNVRNAIQTNLGVIAQI